MRVTTIGAVVIAATWLFTGCRTAVDFAAIQDGQTAARVKTVLVNDPSLGTSIIEVRVEGSVAILTGTVRTQDDVARASALAMTVPGVTRVQADLRIDAGAPSPTVASPTAATAAAPVDDSAESPGDPRLLAVGLSLGWSEPRGSVAGAGLGVGPLVRLGSGRGLGPSLALGWYRVSLPPAPGDTIRSQLRVRPLMAGLGYTFASDRLSFAPSLVAGWAFNDSSAVSATGGDGRLVVDVGKSFVWRPGVSVWIDANRRFAVNLSGGYAITNVPVTFLEDGQLRRTHLRADSALMHAGIAYKVF